MYNLIKTEDDTQVAINQFHTKIKALATEINNEEWTFPTGTREIYETYTIPTNQGKLKNCNRR